MQSIELRDQVIERATSLGFVRVGVAKVSPPKHAEHFLRWIQNKKHGGMSYLEKPRSLELRTNPKEILEGAKSVITVALPYSAKSPPTPKQHHCEVAKYARGKDYHQVMWKLLEKLASSIDDIVNEETSHRVCVDSAPVLERELAAQAGIGFIGKNTMLIAPGVGSYVFLGELFTSLELTPTAPKQIDCGDCTACLDACPTDAFDGPYQLDANKCISYLTIENKDDIPKHEQKRLGNKIFGCDVCQDVCPYNKAAPLKQQLLPEFSNIETDDAFPTLEKLEALGSNQFKRWTEGKALRRFHLKSLKRNLAIALSNQKNEH